MAWLRRRDEDYDARYAITVAMISPLHHSLRRSGFDTAYRADLFA